MATVLKPTQSKIDAQLTQELSKAAQRIRFADALNGGLSLAVLALAYTLIAILLDRWLVLPGTVRLAGLLTFLGMFLGIAYLLLIRPLRHVVNPRFAARKVEQTIPDAKNAIINWVDLKEEELTDAVRLAVASRAVAGVSDGDLNRVAESRRIVWLGVVAGVLVAGLAVVFLLFKPAPFYSLLKRTYNPFTSSGIATRTEINLREPQGGNVTVTSGDQLVVRVLLSGTVPDANSPERVRMMIRYNEDAVDADEVALEQAGSKSEFTTKLPQSVIQNGFWYHIAAGDARTTEYKVTVRSRPMLKDFEVKYEYPAYTRIQPEIAHEPRLEAYHGTRVTLNVKTNRTAREGWLQQDTRAVKVPATIIGEGSDTLQFQFVLEESGAYRIGFTATTDEVSEPSSPYPIHVLVDQKPQVTITKPIEAELTLPLKSLLKVDGLISDDFGVQAVALRMQLPGEKPVALQSKKYRDGKPLMRESDGTFPTSVEYKDSVPLTTLQRETGEAVALQPGMVVEYWLEAIDNCTVPRPNVGRSKVQRVTIAAAEQKPEKQQQQQRDQQDRKNEEKQHQQKQDQQFNNEKRDPQQPHGDQTQQEKPNEQKPNEQNPQTKPAESEGSKQPMPPKEGTPNEQNPKPNEDTQPKPEGNKSEQPKPDPNKPEQNKDTTEKKNDDLQKQADKVSEAMKNAEREPGDGRGQNSDDTKQQEPATTPKPGKPQPNQVNPAEQKAEPKENDPKPEKPSESKDAGQVEQPQPAQQKPEPKQSNNPNEKPNDDGTPQKTRPQDQQSGDKAGQEKSSPDKTNPDKSNDNTGGMKETDPAASRKPESEKPAGEQKQKPDASRGQERAAPKDPNKDDENRGEERPGEAKTEQPPSPANRKKQSDTSNQTTGQQPEKNSAENKPNPSTGTDPQNAPSTSKPEKGSEQSANKDKPLDRKELEDAVKDLKSNDPAKQQAARDKLDKAMGKENREAAEKKAEQLEKDLKSDDPAKRDAAQKEMQDIAKKAKGLQEKNGDKQPQPGTEKPSATEKQPGSENQPGAEKQPGGEKQLDQKDLEQAVKDLKSDDPAKQKAARDKLDKVMGKENREAAEKKAEQLEKDLKSDDPAKRDAAQKEMQDIAKKAKEMQDKNAEKQPGQKQPGDEKQPGAGGENKLDQKELEQAVKDLKSDDPAKQQAARDKLDKAMGKENREAAEKKAEQLEKDLKSDDPAKRDAAQKELQDIAKKAKEMQQQQNGEQNPNDQKPNSEQKQPSAEDIEKWKQKAENLNSPDDAKRQAAEKDFDQAIGQQEREQLQKDLKDLQSDNPNKAAAAKQRLEQKANKNAAPKGKGQRDKFDPKPGERETAPYKKLEEDAKNRLKSAELQLQQLEKARYNKALQEKLGYTPEQFDQFLKSYGEAVERMRTEAEKPETLPAPTKAATGPATIKVGEGSAQKVETRTDGTTGTVGSTGPGTAPPGFAEAQRKFAEEAAKLKKGNAKK